MYFWRLLPCLYTNAKLQRKELERDRRLIDVDAMAHGLDDVLRLGEAGSIGSMEVTGWVGTLGILTIRTYNPDLGLQSLLAENERYIGRFLQTWKPHHLSANSISCFFLETDLPKCVQRLGYLLNSSNTLYSPSIAEKDIFPPISPRVLYPHRSFPYLIIRPLESQLDNDDIGENILPSAVGSLYMVPGIQE